jgi:hypothetical protein
LLELFRVQARAADQRAVDFGLMQQRVRIRRLHAAPVQNAHERRQLLVIQFAQRLADKPAHAVRLICVAHLPRANRPHGFVGNH